MEVTRISRGKIQLRREQVDLAAVIQSAVEISRPFIDAERHKLTVQLPSEPVMLEGDSTRLAQVVANLLNNAAKYTDEGGQIWLTARRAGSNAEVSVRDDGSGVPAEMLPKVFDLFTQADQSFDRSHGGLGIGLTLVRTLVELHGGTVEAKSEGQRLGSEFVVRLPVVAQRIGSRDADQRQEICASVPSHKILVVDDNQDAADSFRMILEHMGARVTVVNDGPDALEALQDDRPSVVFLDVAMPGMDGYELSRRIRLRPGGRDVTLVALTGFSHEADLRRSKEAGIDHHLVKPVDLETLRTLLNSLP